MNSSNSQSTNSGVQIRQLVAEDLNRVHELEVTASPYPWSKKAHLDGVEHNYPSLVMLHDEKIIGFILFNYYIDECHLLNIAIDRDFQRLGLGKALIQKMLEKCNRKQMVKVILEVRESNLSAINLYDSLQFSEIGRRKNYYRGNSISQSKLEDAIVMEKAL